MLQEGEEVEQVFARDNFFPAVSGLPVAVHQEQALCEEITEYVFPRTARTRLNQWR